MSCCNSRVMVVVVSDCRHSCLLPIVVRVVMMMGTHHSPWVVGTCGPLLFVGCGSGDERSPSLVEGDGRWF